MFMLLQATRPGMYPNQLSPMMAAGATQPGLASSTFSAAALNAAISRALSPQPQMAAPIASLANIKPGNLLFKTTSTQNVHAECYNNNISCRNRAE